MSLGSCHLDTDADLVPDLSFSCFLIWVRDEYLSLFWLPDLGFGVVSGMDLVEFVSIWWFVLRFGGL